MKITALTENTSIAPNFYNVHGLSFYIETKKHKILFDMGPDDTFVKNAEILGIKLSDVDIAFISHGHDDHGGALNIFMDINKKAKVYVRENIFEKYFAVHNGVATQSDIDKKFAKNERIVLVKDNMKIDDELFLFYDVKGRKYFSEANKTLYTEKDGKLVYDDFSHEQNLVITSEGKTVLVGGCAHNGIVNIMERFVEINGKEPDFVVSGFHLMNPDTDGGSESKELVNGVANELLKYNSKYYTCHCTGLESYGVLKKVMNDKVDYIAAGQSLEF